MIYWIYFGINDTFRSGHWCTFWRHDSLNELFCFFLSFELNNGVRPDLVQRNDFCQRYIWLKNLMNNKICYSSMNGATLNWDFSWVCLKLEDPWVFSLSLFHCSYYWLWPIFLFMNLGYYHIWVSLTLDIPRTYGYFVTIIIVSWLWSDLGYYLMKFVLFWNFDPGCFPLSSSLLFLQIVEGTFYGYVFVYHSYPGRCYFLDFIIL